ncbi:MAG: DUF167 domain-containing protein [Oligoflexia bacterium]|nr:DUF167 domain-containing protein [Oligoflexia bacterium]MBF0365116.1 DUF167 domain-containing protein [Oligoflexia bacterium]
MTLSKDSGDSEKLLLALTKLGLTIKRSRQLDRDGGILITLGVEVRPGARQERLEMLPAGVLKLWIKAPPIEGKANKEVCKKVAEFLGLSTSAVEVTRGELSKEKEITAHYSFAKRENLKYYLSKIEEVSMLLQKIKILVLVFSFLLLCSSPMVALAEADAELLATPKVGRAQILEMMDAIAAFSFTGDGDEATLLKWKEYLLAINLYLTLKRKVCAGDANATVLGEESGVKNFIAAAEQKFCWMDLQNLEVRLAESTFSSQKRYFEISHARRMKQLEENKNSLIQYLRSDANKRSREAIIDHTLRAK